MSFCSLFQEKTGFAIVYSVPTMSPAFGTKQNMQNIYSFLKGTVNVQQKKEWNIFFYITYILYMYLKYGKTLLHVLGHCVCKQQVLMSGLKQCIKYFCVNCFLFCGVR